MSPSFYCKHAHLIVDQRSVITAQLNDPNYSFNLKSFPVHSDSHLEEVIYRTEVGARVDKAGLAVGVGSERSADMLTVAMRSQLEDCKVKVNIFHNVVINWFEPLSSK